MHEILLLQVVSLHCNLDKNTHHLMNKARLEMMKPDAVLINASRGPVVDEAALVKHLQANPEFRWGMLWGMCGQAEGRCMSRGEVGRFSGWLAGRFWWLVGSGVEAEDMRPVGAHGHRRMELTFACCLMPCSSDCTA